MKRFLVLLVVSLFIFQACKKDNNGKESQQDSVLDYMPLTIGSQWIYEVSTCDSGELNCDPPFSIDTNTVTKDTLMSGNKYYKIEGQHMYWKGPRFYRDSGDFIVDNLGKIIFTISDFDQKYNQTTVVKDDDTMYRWYYRLQEEPEEVSVKAGTFQCYDFRGSFYSQADDFESEENMHNYFAKDVGLVRETAFFASNYKVTKRELIGYVVQPKSTVIP